MEFDAIIVGGSFAGLTTAYYTRAENLLVLEKEKGLGIKQKSTCCAPVDWVSKLGARKSILSKFDKIVFHSPKERAEIDLPIYYCTIDYKVFCESLASQLRNTTIMTNTKVTGVKENGVKKVVCSEKEFSSDILVDASGWRAVLATSLSQGLHDVKFNIRGIESEVEYDTDYIHMFFGRRFIPGGYAWIFPTKDGLSRVGLGSFRRLNLLEFQRGFLEFLGIKAKDLRYHGGIIPCLGLRDPVVDNIFVVGDAAGQVLPVSGEGIRKAFIYSKLCGDLISKVLLDDISLSEALRVYEREVLQGKKFYDALLFLQNIVFRAPDWALNRVIRKAARDRSIPRELLKVYYSESHEYTKTKILQQLLKILL